MRRFISILFFVVLFIFSGCNTSKDVPGDKSAETGSDPACVYISSFPSGLKTYIVPQDVADGPMGELKLRADGYLAGTTPVSLKLEPGKYSVTVETDPHYFFDDGEDSKLFVLKDDQMYPFCKTYNIKKEAGKASLVTALFRKKDQTLQDFMKILPAEESFKVKDTGFFHQVFREHSIPETHWEILISMLRRSGKLAWHGDTGEQFLFAYYTQPGLLAVRPLAEDSTAGRKE